MLMTILFVLSSQLFAGQSDFKYKETSKQSVSKYQRIGHIEKYLSSLNGKIQGMQSGIKSEIIKVNKELGRSLKSDLERQGRVFEERMKKIEGAKTKKFQAEFKEKIEELEKVIEEQKKEMATLKKEMKSLNLVLKTLKSKV